MAEPHWTGYVGMVTGIIGAITGITGAIMGYISYRKSCNLKALDLRLELRKAVSDINLDLNKVRDLIEKANKSRHAVNAARGIRGGATEKWSAEIKADRSATAALSQRAPKPESNNNTMDVKELEAELVSIHRLQGEIQRLADKYYEALRADENNRKELRADDRVWNAPHT